MSTIPGAEGPQGDAIDGSLEVRDNPEESRFEIYLDGQRVGLALYRLQPGRISFVHTETEEALSGRGIGSELIRYALDACRQRGVDVFPYCPFVRGYIERHVEYLELVPEEARGRFGL